MATDLERLVVQLSADITKFERGFNRAQSGAARNFKRIEKNGLQLQARMANIGNNIGAGFAKAFAAAAALRGATQIVDASVRIQNSLKIAGLEGENLNAVYAKLYASAQRNGAPIEALATLYGKSAVAAKELGANQEELLRFNDVVALSLRASGQSAQEASGALLQLSQALGSGRIMAEEYNSILEGARPLLQAVAAGMEEAGGSVSKLTQLVKSGQVSSEAFFRAGMAGAHVLEESVANAEVTISQSFTKLNNSLIDAAGRFNDSAEASEALGTTIEALARFIDQLDFDKIIQGITAVTSAFEQGTSAVVNFGRSVGNALGTDNFGEFLLGENGEYDPFKGTFLEGGLVIKSTKYEQDAKAAAETIKRSNELVLEATGQLPADAKVPDFEVGGKLGDVKGVPPELRGVRDTISIKDYKVPAAEKKGGKKAAKERLDEYQREVRSLQERTAATLTATAAQAALNPLVEDYGYAVEKAAAIQELMTAAQRAGKPVTDQMKADIEAAAEAYAAATVAAKKLDEEQEKIRERAKQAAEFNKDFSRGIVDGFLAGASAAEVLSDSLKKLGNRLLDLAFDQAFGKGGIFGGGGGGGIGSLFGFASGGFTGTGGRNKVAGAVHAGEYVVPKSVVDSLGVSGVEDRLNGLSAPSMSDFGGSRAGNSFTFAPQIDNRGASVEAVARMESALTKLNSEFEGRVTQTMRRNQKSNVR